MKKMMLLLCLLFSLRLLGQPSETFLAPDFTLNDINGNTWNLYELLEDGKTVILDFMATWCFPCWNYHVQHHLETLYEQYGPNGTNELMVFMIEGDYSTGLGALQGNVSNTYGDWVSGTPYPIIDNSILNEPYFINSFPTFYIICRDKLARKIPRMPADMLYEQMLACPAGTQLNNGALLDWTGTPHAVCSMEPFEPKISLSNYGANPITSADIRMLQNGNIIETLHWSGNLSPFENTDVVFAPITIGNPAISELHFDILKINDQDDPDVERNDLDHQVKRGLSTTGQVLTVQLDLGFHAKETYWELRELSTGQVVGSGGNVLVGPDGGGAFIPPLVVPSSPTAYGYGGASPDVTVQVPIPENGCYQFHLVDARGNGFSYETVRLISDGVTLAVATPDEYGGSYYDQVLEFYNVTASKEIEGLSALLVYPNPVGDVLRIDFVLENAESLAISLCNVLGETVYSNQARQFFSGENKVTVATSHLPEGIYFLRLGNDQGQAVRKILIHNH